MYIAAFDTYIYVSCNELTFQPKNAIKLWLTCTNYTNVQRGRRRRLSAMRCIALQLVAAVATLFVFLAMNKFNLQQHSSHNVTPAEAAALRFGFTGKIDLISQSQEQLSSHMRYWENSQKISSESPSQLPNVDKSFTSV